jgi:hypothetical protein
MMLQDIGEQLHAAMREHDAADAEGSCKRLLRALAQADALADIGLGARANNLKDAAIQLSVLFWKLSGVVDLNLESQVKDGSLESKLITYQRVIGELLVLLSATAGVDLTQIGPTGISHMLPAIRSAA